MSDKNNSHHIEIVKSVLYAVVISAWVSLVCNHSQGVANFLGHIKLSIDPLLSLCKYECALMSIGTFAFLTIYFHDEWKYYKSDNYPEEKPSVLCIGWTLFLFQICLIRASLGFASMSGVLGTATITWGLYNAKKGSPKKVKWFIAENLLWIGALIVFIIVRCFNWPRGFNFLLLFPLTLPFVRKIPWAKQFLP